MERVKFTDAMRRVSWGSIFGGVVTVMAISVLLAILASSISFFMLDPTSDSPASGIGTNVGIWTVVALIVSFAGGGFVAGKLAGADGMIHGFLVWSTTTILTVILVISLASGIIRLAGNILGSVGSIAGNVVSGVASGIGNGVSGMSDQIQAVFGDIDFDSDMSRTEVRQEVRQALRRTNVREFQPEYIERQLRAVRQDFDRSLRTLVMNPNDADRVINNFLERVRNRTQTAFQDVDRNDLTRAIANNSSMTQAEVERTVDEYIEFINNARADGRERIENLEQSIEQARESWDQFKLDAREQANQAANAAGRSALWSFIALLVGAAISVFMGMYGARKTQEGYEA